MGATRGSMGGGWVTVWVAVWVALGLALAGCGSSSSSSSSGAPGTAPPSAPTGLQATAGDALVTLSWTAVTGATGYNVYRSTTAGFTPGAANKLTGTPVTAAAYSDSTAADGATYHYAVTAVGPGGESAASAQVSATPQVAAPGAPSSLSATSGDGLVTLSWTAPAGSVDGYNVYRGAATGVTAANGTKLNGATLVTATGYTDSVVNDGTHYYYVVTAVNAGGEGAASSEAGATPQVPVAGAPTGLSATPGNAQVVLSWTAPSGAANGYNVYRGASAGVTATAGNQINSSAVTGTGYTDASVTNGTTYYYVVTALNAGGESAASSPASAQPQTPAPTLLAAAAGNGQVVLNWTAPGSAVSGYNVYRGGATGVTAANGAKLNGGTLVAAVTYTDGAVSNGTPYFYVVTAVNAGGESAVSNQATATPQIPAPAAPTNLSAGHSAGKVSLTWTASGGTVSGYNVYRGATAGVTPGTGTLLNGAPVASPAFSDITGSFPNAYHYVVTAVNAGGASGASNEAAGAPDCGSAGPLVNLVNDQAACEVLGQRDMASTYAALSTPSTSFSGFTDGHGARAGNLLFIPDFDQHRIMVYDVSSPANGMTPSFALGVPDLQTTGFNVSSMNVNATNFGRVSTVSTDGTHLFVPDTERSRVLIWNTIPSASGTPADVVLGAPDFNTTLDTACARNSVAAPTDVAVIGGKLYVTTSWRVMVWNSIPTTNGQLPDYVLGQADFTTCSTDDPAVFNAGGNLVSPQSIATDGTALIIGQGGNRSIAVWNTIPTGPSAAYDFGVYPVNYSGIVQTDGTYLYATESYGIQRYTLPLVTGFPTPGGVVGQASVGATVTGTSATATSRPRHFTPDPSHNSLWVGDGGNFRMLRYDLTDVTTGDGAAAKLVLGQPDFTTATTFASRVQATAKGIAGAGSANAMVVAGGKLWVEDAVNVSSGPPRVVAYDLPVTTYADASLVLGAATLTTVPTGATTAATFIAIGSIASDGTQLVVSDYATNNGRLMVWNTLPTSNNTAADTVWGAPDLTSAAPSGCSATTAGFATGLMVAGGKLALSDGDSNRVMLFNGIPAAPSTAAAHVLGTPSLTDCSTSAYDTAGGVWTDGTRLVFSDSNHNRVLIWNTFPTADGQAPDLVLGQPDMSSTGAADPPTASSMNFPYGVASNGTQLFVADSNNNRILVWNSWPTTNGQAADVVLGRPDFVTGFGSGTNQVSATRMQSPNALLVDNGRLYVVDEGNGFMRILVW